MKRQVIALALLSLVAGRAAHGQTAAPEPLPGNPRFTYPEDAQRLGVVGDASFSVDVDVQGKVTAVRVTEVPLPGVGFEEAVEATLRQWRFRPALKDGRAVAGVHAATVTFRLHPADEEAIRKLVARFAEAWNAGPPEAFEGLLAAEISVSPHPAEPRGSRAGALQWLKARRAEHTGSMSGALKSIRFLAPDLAAMELRVPPAAGARPETGSWSAVASRSGQEWRFVNLRAGAADHRQPLRVGAALKEPTKTKNVPPVYPNEAKQARVQGIVVLECIIGADGKVQDVMVLRSIPGLDRAAIEAVRQWEYTPTLLDGVPVPVIMTVTVNFRLQ